MRFGFARRCRRSHQRRGQQAPDGTEARGRRGADGRKARLRLTVPGIHNLRNAVAALAAVDALGGRSEPAVEALAAVRRRGPPVRALGRAGGVAVVDDYAHHPTELAATLAAARQAFPGRRLVAVFQPHLYSRTEAHGEAMGQALAAADLVDRHRDLRRARAADARASAGGRWPTRPSRRAPTRASSRARRGGPHGCATRCEPGDVVLTLGAGDITRVAPELVRWLSAAA